jgi:uncharacterized SAM-binding protein YcdF (DUF218 family)
MRGTWRSAGHFLLLLVILDLAAAMLWIGAAAMVPAPAPLADAIAVLWGDGDHLGEETEARLSHAIELWHAGRAPLILCIGGTRHRPAFSGEAEMQAWLISAGIPASKVLTGAGSNDTVSNLREIAGLAAPYGLRSALVVTDPLQALRVKILAGHVRGPALITAPYRYRISGVRMLALWAHAHVEWLGLVALALPESWRRLLLDYWRG